MTKKQYSGEYIKLKGFQERFLYCNEHNGTVQDLLELFVVAYQQEGNESEKIGRAFRVFDVAPKPKTDEDFTFLAEYYLNNSQGKLSISEVEKENGKIEIIPVNPISVSDYKEKISNGLNSSTNKRNLLDFETVHLTLWAEKAAKIVGNVIYNGVPRNSFEVMYLIVSQEVINYSDIHKIFIEPGLLKMRLGRSKYWSSYDEATLLFIVAKCRCHLENNIHKTDRKATGYYINLTDDQLTELYQKLVDARFLKPTNADHFVNAFNGKELVSFERIKWVKNVYANLFVRINIADAENPQDGFWQRAEQLFNNGNANSLKNAVNAHPIDKHVKYQRAIEQLIKDLQ